ncbi:MAG: histidine phosphatase family protein [Solirubrobacteraceae bacterium]|nr:histidine phosphatase family protein [Solirubrobacteraceae bacterium]
MSVVLMVRHAHASFGLGSYDRLSDHGRDQARRLAEVLGERGLPVERIVCGALQRQRETADLLATALGDRPIHVDARWNEYEYMPLIARVKPMYRRHWLMVADLARTGNPSRRLQEVIDRALALWVDDTLGTPTTEDDDELLADAPAVVDPRSGELLQRPDGGRHELDLPDDPSAIVVESFLDYSRRIHAALDDVSTQSGMSLVVSSAGSIAAAAAPLLGIPPTGWPALQRVMVNTSVTKVVRGQRGITLVSFNEHGHLEGVPGLKITYR